MTTAKNRTAYQRARKRIARTAIQAVPQLREAFDERRDLQRRVGKMEALLDRLQEENRELKVLVRSRRRDGAGGGTNPAVPTLDVSGLDLDYLFIVTYGRSGSTLLQGLLSAIPGYLIRGENGGAVYDVYRFHTVATKWRDQLGEGAFVDPTKPFYGLDGYTDALAFREIRRMLLGTLIRPEPDVQVVGFKEIRWHHDDLSDYIDFLRAVFPGARFVFNTRELNEVVRSKWWADQPHAMEKLVEFEAKMLDVARRLGPDAHHVHYNDYVRNPQCLAPLFEWLKVDFDESAVRAVMGRQHSY